MHLCDCDALRFAATSWTARMMLALLVAFIAATTANAVNPFGSEVPKVDNYLPVRNPALPEYL